MRGQCLVLFGMLALTALFLLLSLVYGGWIRAFLRDWQALSLPKALKDFNKSAQTALDPITLPRVSVLVPARNEEDNIGALLTALQVQHYPADRLEIIVIDDHSEDQTAAIVKEFKEITLLRLDVAGINSYKKKALEEGVAKASGELIVCTDADCIPGPHWIEQLVACYRSTGAKFIAAPVALTYQQNGLGYLQALDFMVLQGITGAGLFSGKLLMANGANLAYPKAVFNEVNGYAGTDHIASGDDFFLLHKIADRYPNQIAYLKSKEALVTTAAQPTWSTFLQQRIRWASKSTHYKKGRLQQVLSLVWSYNLLLLLLAIGGIFDSHSLLIFIGGWMMKTMVEWSFVSEVAGFFGQKALLKKFFWLQPLHMVYTVVAGALGLSGNYRWKGRTIR
ncbi:MAG: glycosyltransferase [Sphingomonadales bacterium]|nr:glycosyltransferase [Sphingomonadales bacterium]